MATAAGLINSELAEDVVAGLSQSGQKKVSSRYFYDDLGSSLFDAITLLPEYGLTRADERLLRTHALDLARKIGEISTVTELGSGSGRKTRPVLEALVRNNPDLLYRPIDVSSGALELCERQLQDVVAVQPILGDWFQGLDAFSASRAAGPALLLFLGSTVGNLERSDVPSFFSSIRSKLEPWDYFLLGADLVKDVDVMLSAYDDPTGVTAAFNLNILGRINRELDADFDLRSFAHEARWNADARRIEMHLLSGRDQSVHVRALDRTFHFQAGETIWTESSHKFSSSELDHYASSTGFATVASWTDREWPFTNVLWRAV